MDTISNGKNRTGQRKFKQIQIESSFSIFECGNVQQHFLLGKLRKSDLRGKKSQRLAEGRKLAEVAPMATLCRASSLRRLTHAGRVKIAAEVWLLNIWFKGNELQALERWMSW